MSLFDFNSIAETVYRGVDPSPDWVMVPEGEYILQATKITGREVEGRRVVGTFIFCEISWEVLDDEVRRATNMAKPTVLQSFSLQMLNGTNDLDWNPNQNMQLRGVLKACGIHNDRAINKIMNQTVYGRVEHEPMIDGNGPLLDAQGRPQMRARVTRVTTLDHARHRTGYTRAADTLQRPDRPPADQAPATKAE
jgi:hypothetical protein